MSLLELSVSTVQLLANSQEPQKVQVKSETVQSIELLHTLRKERSAEIILKVSRVT
jgi:hypothetical protein